MINNKFENIFEPPPPPKTALYVLGGIIILLIILVLFGASNYSLPEFKFKDENSRIQFNLYTSSIIIGLLANLLASYLYDDFRNKYRKKVDNLKINQIKSLANHDLIKDIFNDLAYYDNYYCKDYTIEIKLKKSTFSDNLFEYHVKYKYKKILKSRDLIFKFVRIVGDSDVSEIEQNEVSLSQNYMNNEFYYTFDERSFSEISKYDQCYKLKSLDIIVDDRLKQLKFDRTFSINNIIYKSTIDFDIEIRDKLIELNYEVVVPIEKESFYYHSIELPTQTVRCEFDFTEVANEIEFNSADFLSSHRGPLNLHKSGDTIIKLFKDDWVLPKSTFLFVWYKK